MKTKKLLNRKLTTMIKIVSKNLPFIDLISFVEIFSSVSKNIY